MTLAVTTLCWINNYDSLAMFVFINHTNPAIERALPHSEA